MPGEGAGGNCVYVLGEDGDLYVGCYLRYVAELGSHAYLHACLIANLHLFEGKFIRFLPGSLEVCLEVNQQEWFGLSCHRLPHVPNTKGGV